MSELLIFGSEGAAGQVIRKKYVDAVRIDVDSPEYRLDYLSPRFREEADIIFATTYGKRAIIASGINPSGKVPGLSIHEFSIDSSVVNFVAPFVLCQKMIKRGFEHVIVFTSAAALTNPSGCAEYAAWKAALNSSVMSLASEYPATRLSLYSPGHAPHPFLIEDIDHLFNQKESGQLFVRYKDTIYEVPLKELCAKATN